MKLAIFDLDNTLLAGDSDHLWGEYLATTNRVDADYYRKENDRFFQQYQDGTLDIMEYLSLALKPLADNAYSDLLAWRDDFFNTVIKPLIPDASRELLQRHRSEGDFLMIITATNSFVTAPIAESLGVDHLIATEPEFIQGEFTGKVQGLPTFQDGKVTHLNQWLRETGHSLDDSYFYSDSHNDLPLLEVVTHPIAVNPDETLKAHAEKSAWPIIQLH